MLYYVKVIAKLGLVVVMLVMALISIMEFGPGTEARKNAIRGMLVGGAALACVCISIVIL